MIAAASVALLALAARDDPTDEERSVHYTVAPVVRNYGNLRIGPTSSSRRANLCLDVAPWARLSFETCGTGSGMLHDDPDPQVMHVLANWGLARWSSQRVQLEPRVGAGFAELQIGEDSPGFHFTGVGSGGRETAGPEAVVSLHALVPVGSGFELVGNLSATLAWMPHAPELRAPQDTWQPGVTLTLGAGF